MAKGGWGRGAKEQRHNDTAAERHRWEGEIVWVGGVVGRGRVRGML